MVWFVLHLGRTHLVCFAGIHIRVGIIWFTSTQIRMSFMFRTVFIKSFPDKQYTHCRDTERVEVNLIVCCSRSHILHKFSSLKSILASALHIMLQGFGMICLIIYVQLNLSSFRKKLKTYLFGKAYRP